MALPIQITVGGAGQYDPAVDTTDYVNPSLKGKEFYVSLSAYGPLPYSDWEPLADGGFRLTKYKFSEEEIYFVTPTSIVEQVSGNSYTNGFNYQRVINAMLSRIGFRQPTLAGYNIVDSSNQMTASGRYFDDFHSLVRIKNIKETIEDQAISNADFNAYLESLKRSVIMRSLNAVLNVPEQLERVLLFERSYNQPEVLIENSSRFVGFEINVAQTDSIAVQIESATLLFDSNVDLRLYLFKDGKKSPIWTQDVSAEANEATVVSLDSLILNYIGQFTKGSRFYFGYFQDELGEAKAIREQSCHWNKQLCFSSQSISSLANGNDFNRSEVSGTYDTFGLNLEITSFRDHTNAIVKQAPLFDELVGLNMAYAIVEQVLYSTRSNATERILKSETEKNGVQMDLNGTAPIPGAPRSTGLKQRIERELKRVKDGFYSQPRAQTINLSGC